MQAADIAALSRLLDVALALNVARREEWLASLPAEMRHLAQPLREMLAESDSPHGNLARMPRLDRDEGPGMLSAGERVGAYRLLREIGRGGMGSVWLAERADGSFERRVALKLPRLAWMDGLAARMARERRIGALLEHPHIARMYDAGVDERGRPYIAMAGIEGLAIDLYCRERRCDTRARLRSFQQVVRAVAYAHGRLIVHRDLKPANVLVDAEGQAHLLDFGIAKLLDDSNGNLTQEQGRVLTPSYAAPEQIAGQAVGVAADVYSLGVMLYQLVAGVLPYSPSRPSAAAMEEAILAGEAPRASSRVTDKVLARTLRGDVDAIIAKAMQRDIDRRYATADALADDIDRFLAGETVRARPDGVWYRARKFLRRHRVAAASTAAVTLALLLGVAATMVQADRAARAGARELVVKRFVAEVLRINSHARPAGGDKARSPAELLLEKDTGLIQTRFPDQPDIQAELYEVVGNLFSQMRAYGLAADCFRHRMDVLATQHESGVERERARLSLAEALFDDGKIADAEAAIGQVLALSRKQDGLFGDALVLLARIQGRDGRTSERNATLRLAEEALGGTAGPPSISRAWLAWLQADVISEPGRFDLGLPLYLGAIAMAEKAAGSQAWTTILMKLELGWELVKRNRQQDALAQIEPALVAAEKGTEACAVCAESWRANLWRHMDVFETVSSAEALAVVRQSRLALDASGESVPKEVRIRVDLAESSIMMNRGSLVGAVALFDAAARLHAGSDASWMSVRESLDAGAAGQLAMQSGAHDAAEQLLREQQRQQIAAGLGTSPFGAWNYFMRGLNRTMQGRLDLAASILEEAPPFGLVDGAAGADRYWQAQAIPWEKARVRLESGDAKGAATIAATLEVSDDKGLFASHDALRAEILCAAGFTAEGSALFDEVIAARASRADSSDPVLARHRAVAGRCLLQGGDRLRSLDMERRARLALQTQPVVSDYYRQPLAQLQRALTVDRAAAKASARSSRAN